MIPATVLFVVAVLALIGAVLYALRMMSRRTDQLYREVLLDDAVFAIKHEDRVTLEAEAFTFASVGWDMPDLTEHMQAARAAMEAYDLEQEMLADLDSAINALEDS